MMPFDLAEFPEALEPPAYRSFRSAWVMHLPMATLLMGLLRPRVLVELGAHGGDSYMRFCQGVGQFGLETRCTAVDLWTGDEHSGAYDPSILAQLRAAHDPLYGGFSRLFQASFDEASKTFWPGCVDLLHVDGCHSYEAVRHDFETWLPLMSERGVMVFHDTAARLPGFGVWQFWEEVSASRPQASVEYGYGLGLLAVVSKVPQAFLEFLEALRTRPGLRKVLERYGRMMEKLQDIPWIVSFMREMQHAANVWRTQTGQPVRTPVVDLDAMVADIHKRAPAAMADVQQVVNDALGLGAEVMALRQRAKP